MGSYYFSREEIIRYNLVILAALPFKFIALESLLLVGRYLPAIVDRDGGLLKYYYYCNYDDA